jgi:hypothetical protein
MNDSTKAAGISFSSSSQMTVFEDISALTDHFGSSKVEQLSQPGDKGFTRICIDGLKHLLIAPVVGPYLLFSNVSW